MKIGAYVRVSTTDQAERETPKLQRDAIERWLKDHPEYDAVEWYEDAAVSGTVFLKDREAGGRLLADLTSGALDAVVCYKYDRMHRDHGDAFEVKRDLDRLGREMFSTCEDLKDWFTTGIHSLVAMKERETIVARMRAGARANASRGKWVSGSAPIGYRIQYVMVPDAIGQPVPDRRAGTLVIDEHILDCGLSPAAVVRELFRQSSVERRSCVALARWLNDRRVPTRFQLSGRQYYATEGVARDVNGAWSPGMVLGVLKAPTYKGTFIYGKRNPKAKGKRPALAEEITVAVPALVSEAEWTAVQATLKINLIAASRNTKRRTYLLRGLLRCGSCGRIYVGSDSTSGYSYRCNSAYPKGLSADDLTFRCPGARVDFDVEAMVWADVTALFRNEDAVVGAMERYLKAQAKLTDVGGDAATRDREAARRALTSLGDQQSRLVTLYTKGTVDEATLDRENSRLMKERAGADRLLTEADAALARTIAIAPALANVRDFARTVNETIRRPDLDHAARRRIIEAVVIDGTVHTVRQKVDVRRGARVMRRESFASITMRYRLGLQLQYHDLRLVNADVDLHHTIHDRTESAHADLDLSDYEITPDDGAIERALDIIASSTNKRASCYVDDGVVVRRITAPVMQPARARGS